MKRNLIFIIFILISINIIGSCHTLNTVIKKDSDYMKSKKGEHISEPFNKYLSERVWRLAGCKLAEGFQFMDANMNAAKINFSNNGRFEATSGITNYIGTWKQKAKKKQLEYNFELHINSKTIIDTSNIIGKPFDNTFEQNLKETKLLQIQLNEIKFYSKDGELLMHFIRL